jgi:manganese efflux pump family protein
MRPVTSASRMRVVRAELRQHVPGIGAQDRDCFVAGPSVRLGAVPRIPGAQWRYHAATTMVAAAVLAGVVAGCSSQPAMTTGSANSCFLFALSAIHRHVTVTSVPAACQGLSHEEVNIAVDRALRAATAGVRGKVAQRELIGHDSLYVAGLIRAVRASSQPAVTAPPSRSPSQAALNLAALIAWLVTVGLGVSMMARWITRIRRHGAQRRGRGPVLNFTHFGLALTGLLIWISYLATGLIGLAWTACGLLLVVAGLGMALLFLAPAAAAAETRPVDVPPPAGRPPVPVIAAHITAACVTILIATLAAIGPR